MGGGGGGEPPPEGTGQVRIPPRAEAERRPASKPGQLEDGDDRAGVFRREAFEAAATARDASVLTSGLTSRSQVREAAILQALPEHRRPNGSLLTG